MIFTCGGGMPGISIWNSSIKCWLFLDKLCITFVVHYIIFSQCKAKDALGKFMVVDSAVNYLKYYKQG